MTDANTELARIVREHAGRLAASLTRLTGDFSAAEDLVQDAVMGALRRWPVEGIPARPEAWLFTAARNRGIDLLRRETTLRTKLEQLQWPVRAEPDDRLRLIFICCHPALSREAQIALTLRGVCGLTTAEIAQAFLVPEATLAQRITRAKRKIADTGIPFALPAAPDLADRLTEVLTVVYLLFNEGYLPSTDSERAWAPDEDASWLAALLHELLPDEPEVTGLLALIRLHRARTRARFTPGGDLVLLADQDRALWDRDAIVGATALLARAARSRRPGPFQLQAAIVACHAEATDWASTDWEQIVLLYDMLLHVAPSPVARMHRAIALHHTAGPRAALAELDALTGPLAHHHLFHAARADTLRALGHHRSARDADKLALALARNPAEQALLHDRIRG